MSYKETVQWMFAQLPMYQYKGVSAFNEKLETIEDFAGYLDNPHKKFKSVHVAGTNGKGSSSHMLASILMEAGYKVGLYTSPHLKDFRERIKINGKKVKKAFVTNFVERNMHYLKRHQLSFFEMTVGMAFQCFAEAKVDIAIIEVGLGGRLDSTNIITPEVSLITNIGMDHKQLLGNTLEKIALEKAGIIKRGVPVVISERQKETTLLFELIANQLHSEIVFTDESDIPKYETDLMGAYQELNIKGVVCTLQFLGNFEITKKHIKKGLKNVVKNTGLLGRWQVLSLRPALICDTAHNKEGLQLVIDQLKGLNAKKIHFVLGFVNDKNVDELLALFPKKGSYYFVKPDVPRGLDLKELQMNARLHKLDGECYNSVLEGLEIAKAKADKKDVVFIGGSTFVVAEIV